MDGSPAAIAACNAVPRPSNSEGNANASRAAYTCAISFTNPGKKHRFCLPRCLVSACSSVRQAPSPASNSRTSGCNALTRGSASTKCRCPFSGTNTLTQPNKNSFSRTPQRFRALLRCSGVRKGKISTPSFTIEIRSAAMPESIRLCGHIFAVRYEPFHGPVACLRNCVFLKWESNSAGEQQRKPRVRPRPAMPPSTHAAH